MRNSTSLAIWFCGLLLGIFLMVADELINLSLSCGYKCSYPFPILGQVDIWDAWAITFGMIVGIVGWTMIIIGETQRAAA